MLFFGNKKIRIKKRQKKFPFLPFFVGVAGFEPTTPCSQSRCANRTALHPVHFFQMPCKDTAFFDTCKIRSAFIGKVSLYFACINNDLL